MTGCCMRLPGRPAWSTPSRCPPQVDLRALQPQPTAFERAAAAGVAVTRVGPRRFDGAGLTEAALRGGDYAARRAARRAGRAAAAAAVRRGERCARLRLLRRPRPHRPPARARGRAAWRAELTHVDRARRAAGRRAARRRHAGRDLRPRHGRRPAGGPVGRRDHAGADRRGRGWWPATCAACTCTAARAPADVARRLARDARRRVLGGSPQDEAVAAGLLRAGGRRRRAGAASATWWRWPAPTHVVVDSRVHAAGAAEPGRACTAALSRAELDVPLLVRCLSRQRTRRAASWP